MQPPRPTVSPEAFRSQSRFVGLIGLLMDVLVAAVIIAFRPFEQSVTYLLVALLIGVGLVLTFVFAVVFPKRYETYYKRMSELEGMRKDL